MVCNIARDATHFTGRCRRRRHFAAEYTHTRHTHTCTHTLSRYELVCSCGWEMLVGGGVGGTRLCGVRYMPGKGMMMGARIYGRHREVLQSHIRAHTHTHIVAM